MRLDWAAAIGQNGDMGSRPVPPGAAASHGSYAKLGQVMTRLINPGSVYPHG
jgi:hypothetical protein